MRRVLPLFLPPVALAAMAVMALLLTPAEHTPLVASQNNNFELSLNNHEATDSLSESTRSWHLRNVPDDTLFVVQGFANQPGFFDAELEAHLWDADGMLLRSSTRSIGRPRSIRLTHRLTGGPADLTLDIQVLDDLLDYGLFVETVTVSGTVPFNDPEGVGASIPASRLPLFHYYSVVVPPVAAGERVELRFSNANGADMRGEVVRMDGELVTDFLSSSGSRALNQGEYIVAVSGAGTDGMDLNQKELSDYKITVVAVPKPEAGFAMDDLSRAAPEGNQFTLTATLSGAAARELTLDVDYSGGGGYEGPDSVRIASGASSGMLELNVPHDGVVGTVPETLTVTLSLSGNAADDLVLSSTRTAATISFTDRDLALGRNEEVTAELLRFIDVHRWYLNDVPDNTFFVVQSFNDVDVRGLLLAADGRELVSVDDSFFDRRQFRIAHRVEGGEADFILEVRAAAFSATGTYGLFAETVNVPDLDTVGYNNAQGVTSSLPASRLPLFRYHRVVVPKGLAGQAVTVRVRSMVGTAPTLAELLHADGELSLESRGGGANHEFKRALASGEYIVGVGGVPDSSGLNQPMVNSYVVTFTGPEPRAVGFATDDVARTVLEDEPFTLTVELSEGTAGGDINLDVGYSGGNNYMGPATVMIPAGATSTELPLNVPRDGMAGIAETLTVTLSLSGDADVVLSSAGAVATITINNNRDLALDGGEFTGELQTGQSHRWYLNGVPDDTLLVVHSFGQDDLLGRLQATGISLREDDAFGRLTFRITHRVTGGPTDFRLAVQQLALNAATYGLVAEAVRVPDLDTVVYNDPDGSGSSLPASRLPRFHYYRVVVPPEAAGQEVTVRIANDNDDNMRVELLRANGRLIFSSNFDKLSEYEIKETLAPGEYIVSVSGADVDSDGLNQNGVRDYVVTLRGPESDIVSFATDDLSRTVPENETFTLTVAVAPGLGVATKDVVLDVGYSGGGGYTGPATVTIPAGATSTELTLNVPNDGMAGPAETLTVTLRVMSGDDDTALSPTGAEAVITVINRDLAFGGSEVTGTLSEVDEVHIWYLTAVPKDALLVVQSLNDVVTDVAGELFEADGTTQIRRTNNFLNQRAFRITHPVTDGPADFVLKVSGVNNSTGTYGLFAEMANVVGTVEYNRPESPGQTLAASPLPSAHYYRVVVPAAAGGQEVTVRVASNDGDQMRVELMRADGSFLVNASDHTATKVIERTLAAGEYFIAVNGWIGRLEGNRNQNEVGDYVVTLRGPEVVGFAADDQTRMVAADGAPFTLTVAVAPDLGVALQDVTLDVGYSGGNFTGPATVTIPQGESSTELSLQAPAVAPAPVTVTLSNPSSGSVLRQADSEAMITFTGPRVVGFTTSAATVEENEDIMLTVELAAGRMADGDLTLDVGYSGRNNFTGPATVKIDDGVSSATLQLKVPNDGMAGIAESLTVTLSLSGSVGDDIVLSPTGAEAVITILNRDLATDRSEVTGEVTQADQVDRWYLTNVPADTLLVVQSLNQVNVVGRLLDADGVQLREVDDFLNQTAAFRITHRVTATANFILEVGRSHSNVMGEYGLIAEIANVVSTVQYNAPAGASMTINGSRLPRTYYHRLVVPPEAAGLPVTVIAESASNGMRVELLNADGTHIVNMNSFVNRYEITRTLDQGEYYLAVNGWVGFNGGNLNQEKLDSHVVTLQGPQYGFATDDVSRTVLEGEMFTLTVTPGSVPVPRDVTLHVDYSGGNSYMGPATVMIPAGQASAELPLNVPNDGMAGIAESLTVTLRLMTSDEDIIGLSPTGAEAAITVINRDLATDRSEVTGEVTQADQVDRWYLTNVPADTLLVVQSLNQINTLGRLLDADGVPLREVDDFLNQGAFRITHRVTATANFIIEVGRSHSNVMGEYGLFAELANVVGTVEYNAPAGSPIAIAGDPLPRTHYYRVVVPPELAGQDVTVIATSSNGGMRVELLNADGALIEQRSSFANRHEITRTLAAGEYYLAVNGWVGSSEGNRGQRTLHGVVVTLRGPGYGFAINDMSRTVLEGEMFTLTVAALRGLGAATEEVTLDVEYSGGGGHTGPATVTIPNGGSSATLQLNAPRDGVAGSVPDPLVVTLSVSDDSGVLLSADPAIITFVNRDLATDRIEVKGELTQVGQTQRWHLTAVPADALLVVQSLNARSVNVSGRLLATDGTLLKEVDDFLTGNSFRITHRVTATANFILDVSGVGNSMGDYGLIAELANVVGTVEYNRPEGTPRTIPSSDLPQTHYVRLVVPPEAAGLTVTVNVRSVNKGLRVELLNADGTLIEKRNSFVTSYELTLMLAPGTYYLAVNGWIGFQGGNRDQATLHDYVVNLRGPEFVGFAADDLTRTVAVDETLTLTVAVGPGLVVATRDDVGLDVGYSGGGNYMGPDMVTITAGTRSVELPLRVPGTAPGTLPPPLMVTLSNPSSGSHLLQGATQAVITFSNLPAVGFGRATYLFTEGEKGVTVPVELGPGNLAGSLTVMVTGAPGGPQTVELTNDNRSGNITFDVPDDNRAAPPPGVVLTIVDNLPPDQARLAHGLGIATVRFRDDGDAVARAGIVGAPAALPEGGTATLMVELANSVQATRTVMVTVSDGRDFTQMVEIASGTNSTTFEYTAPDDKRAAPPPPATLELSAPVNSGLQDAARRIMIRIEDNDPLAVVGFVGETNLMRTEGEMVTLRVELQNSVPATRAIEVRVDLSGGLTGEETLTIADGANFAEVPITLPHDDVADVAPMPVVAMLRVPPNDHYEIGTGAMVTITIADDDAVPLVGFGAAEYTFTEGARVTVTVDLKPGQDLAPAMEPLTVMVTGVPDRTEPLMLMLTNNDRSADITFDAPADGRHAPLPDVVLMLAIVNDPSGEVRLAPGLDMATVRFTNDDPLARVAFKVSDRARTVDEGASVELTVELQDGVTATRAINLMVTGFPEGASARPVIPLGGTFTTLTFTAPVNNVAGMVPAALNLELEVVGDEAALDPNGARAMFTMADREETLPLDGSEVTGVLAAGQVHRWHLQAVPDNTLLVVQSVSDNNVDVVGRLLAADGVTELRENDNFLNLNAFRITHPVTGTANFILEVRGGSGSTTGAYGLFAQKATVVGTVEYNRPETPPRTIDTGRLPQAHYHRVMVPQEATGRMVTLRAANPNGHGMRVELLDADGNFITNVLGTPIDERIITRMLAPGEYFLIVNGGGGFASGNLNPSVLSDYVVTLRGPDFVGFAAHDQTRMVPVDQPFTLAVTVVPGLGLATKDVTLDVSYTGGGGYTGPLKVTITAGTRLVELPLRAPAATTPGVSPDALTVTLSNPSSGSELIRDLEEATVTFTTAPLVGFGEATYLFTEGEKGIMIPVELKPGENLDMQPLTVMVTGAPGGTQTVQLRNNNNARTAYITFDAPDDNRAAPPRDIVLTIVDNFPPAQAVVVPGLGMATVRFRDNGDPVARAGFADITPITLDEGGRTMLNVELAGGERATRAVMVTVSDGLDFSEMVTIESGTSLTTFEYTAPDDQSAVPEVQVMLTLSAPMNGGLNADAAEVDITVRNKDVVTVGFGAASYVFTEGAQVTVPVELTTAIDPDGEIMVMVTVTGFPDGQPQTQTVTLSVGARSADVTFTAPNDERHAPPDDVTLMLSAPQDVVVAGSGMATVRFTDEGDPVAEVRFVDGLTDHPEGATVTLRVQLQGSLMATRAIEVRVALSGSVTATQSLTIETGTNSGSIQIVLPQDTVDFEAPDPVVATLIAERDLYRLAVAADEREVTLVIRDDDGSPSVGFELTEYTFDEGSEYVVTVEFKSAEVPTRTVNLQVLVNGQVMQMPTLDPSDAANTRSVSFTLDAPDNEYSNIAPPDVELSLKIVSGDVELAPGFESATVRFRDDDPVPRVRFVSNFASLGDEGEMVTLTVQLQPGVTATRAITVRVALRGGLETETLLTISESATSGTVSFVLPDDNDRNTAPAAVVATLLSVDDSYMVATGTGVQAAITVADYDAPALVGFAVTMLMAVGETATLTLRLELAGGVPATRAVSVLVNFGDDRDPQTVTIETGARFTLLQVPVSAALALTLSTPMNAVLLSGSDMASISLTDPTPPGNGGGGGGGGNVGGGGGSGGGGGGNGGNGGNGGGGGGGGAMLMLTVTPAGPSEVREGNDITYTITRATTDAVEAISVQVGISPRSSGARTNDLATVGTVELAAGVTSVEHVVTALLDADNEGDERFAITFMPVDGDGSSLGPQQSSELTVTNLAFGLTADITELSEGDTALVRVTRPEGVALDRQYTLMIEAMRVSPRGAATDDLQVPATVTLRSGQPFVEFRVRALSDLEEEEDERFTVTVAGAGMLDFTVADAAHLPGAGGVELGWGALAVLLALALLLATTGGALLTRRVRRSR